MHRWGIRLHAGRVGICLLAMDRVGGFPEKLGLAMRIASLSRVALAQALGVDKSLIGRWLSGAVHPTEHNLARLAGLIATSHPDFTLADWFVDSPDFAARLGLPGLLPAESKTPNENVLGGFVERARAETARRGSSYEGFWRTTRPSLLMTDTLFHDYGLIRRAASGLLEVRMKGAGLGFSGWMMPGEGNLFVFLDDPVGMTPLSLAFRGVSLPRAMVLDGLLLLAGLDAGRTIGALPIVLERVGDLSGDLILDDARCETMANEEPPPLEPIDPTALRNHIFRGAAGQDVDAGAFLAIDAGHSLSRGSTNGGLSG